MKQRWVDALENDYSESSDNKLEDMKDKAYTYLVLVCESCQSFNIVSSTDNRKNGCKGWKALSAKYNAQDMSDYIKLAEDSSSSRLSSN
jgi:hypothetical protein